MEDEKEDENGRAELGAKMSFLEHLDELRKRLITSIIYIAVGFVACWFFHEEIYRFIARPIQPYLKGTQQLIFTKPTEAFTLYFKVSCIASVFLTAPLLLHQLWMFIAPGLYRREKRMALPFVISSIFLFYGGGAFAYYFVLPAAYGFLLGFGSDFQPMIKIDEYWDLTSTIILGFGLMFELPVVVAFLSLFGLITPRFLWKNFKYAILVIFIVAAVLSPTPDAVNQTIYAVPMMVLYVVSILVSWIFQRRREKQFGD
jgi:sec-independent protein translocase protein TatC